MCDAFKIDLFHSQIRAKIGPNIIIVPPDLANKCMNIHEEIRKAFGKVRIYLILSRSINPIKFRQQFLIIVLNCVSNKSDWISNQKKNHNLVSSSLPSHSWGTHQGYNDDPEPVGNSRDCQVLHHLLSTLDLSCSEHLCSTYCQLQCKNLISSHTPEERMRENIGISSMYTHILANICFKFYYHNTLKFKHLHCNIILYTSGSKKRLQELGHPKVFFFYEFDIETWTSRSK